MKKMNCVSTMPEIMPEITDEAIIEALFAQRPYEEKVINSAFLEIPAEYQRKLNIPNVEKMSAEFTELIANPPKVSYRDGHYFVFDGQHTIVTRRAMNGGQDLPISFQCRQIHLKRYYPLSQCSHRHFRHMEDIPGKFSAYRHPAGYIPVRRL